MPCAIFFNGSRPTALIWIIPYCPSGTLTPRPSNFRQNAVLGGQTVHVSSAVAVALHRPAAMALAGVGTPKGRPRVHSRMQHQLTSKSRNVLPSLRGGHAP